MVVIGAVPVNDPAGPAVVMHENATALRRPRLDRARRARTFYPFAAAELGCSETNSSSFRSRPQPPEQGRIGPLGVHRERSVPLMIELRPCPKTSFQAQFEERKPRRQPPWAGEQQTTVVLSELPVPKSAACDFARSARECFGAGRLGCRFFDPPDHSPFRSVPRNRVKLLWLPPGLFRMVISPCRAADRP